MNNALPPLQDLDLPTKWPFTNARLRGLVAGFPVKPLDRLANFGADEFGRFALEWVDGYLSKKLPESLASSNAVGQVTRSRHHCLVRRAWISVHW